MMKCILGVVVAIIGASLADISSADPVVVNHKGYTSYVEDPLRVETGPDIECRKLGNMVTVRPGGSPIIQGGKVVRGEDGCKRSQDSDDDEDDDEADDQGGSAASQEEKSSLPAYQTGPSQIWK